MPELFLDNHFKFIFENSPFLVITSKTEAPINPYNTCRIGNMFYPLTNKYPYILHKIMQI